MDSETRHELERNSLAELMVKSTHAARNTWMYWVGGIAVIAVAGIAVLVWNVSRAEQLQRAWQAFEDAKGQPDALEQLIVDYPGMPVVAPAHMSLGWARFVDGKRQIIDNRGEGIRLFDEAIEEFEKAMGAPSSEDIKGQALFGVALAHEYQCKVDQAREGYETVIAQFSGYQIAELSKKRLERLNDAKSSEFYTAMKNYSPPAPTTDLPPKIEGGLPEPGIVPGIPNIDPSLPSSDLLPNSPLLPSTPEPGSSPAPPTDEEKDLPPPPSSEPSTPAAPSEAPPTPSAEPAPPAPAEPAPAEQPPSTPPATPAEPKS